MRQCKILFFLLCCCLLFFCMSPVFALIQHDKLWLAAYLQKPISKDEKWLYSLFFQLKLIDQTHVWQKNIFDAAMIYVLAPDKSIWLGYRWEGSNPYNNFYQLNQFWQQLMWNLAQDKNKKIYSRSRLEESKPTNQHQLSYVLRERISLELLKRYFGKLNPFLYDEAFFLLNETSYTPHRVIGENRIFIGFNWYTSARANWEIGYMNQYQLATPNYNQNQMNHVLTITYNMV